MAISLSSLTTKYSFSKSLQPYYKYLSNEDFLILKEYIPEIIILDNIENLKGDFKGDTKEEKRKYKELKKYKEDALIDACGQGDIVATRLLLKLNTNPLAQNNSALHIACKQGHMQIINLLLSAKADLTSKNNLALRTACNNGRTDVVQLLLQAKGDPKALNNWSLIQATKKRYSSIVKLLLEAKADPSVYDNWPLEITWMNNDKTTHDVLISYPKADSSIIKKLQRIQYKQQKSVVLKLLNSTNTPTV